MRKPYVVKCLSAKYDVEQEILVLACFFEESKTQRIVHFKKSDFHYKNPENEVPDLEMHKTAGLFLGKRFKLVIEDDPNRNAQTGYNVAQERDILKSSFQNEEDAIEAKFANLSNIEC